MFRTWRARGRVACLLLLPLLLLPSAVADATGPPAPSSVRALFFGDSLMNGTGARPVRPVMARVAARALGWDVTVNAFGGTGFTTGGRNGERFLTRLQAPGVLDPSYDVVVLAGGTNDRSADVATVRVQAVLAIAYVQQRLPRAHVVLMGAFNPTGRGFDRRRERVDLALREAARERSVPFFSPISQRWMSGQGNRVLSPDGLHPSTYGYGVMGWRLAGALRTALAHAPGS